ncbi:hypothetical protein Ami103574_00060 [Aminipila butyrica]|uniref:Phage tail tape measure protein n=1 Tax=Aminipila butyrica TaxID=433296 RepID=A0A858BQK8_9FIRM|nr:hypothetical protein [Aminipila butyrica]QIB67807.1 hypothetical protein Ami103574_00060 [Aminipila butyrica]
MAGTTAGSLIFDTKTDIVGFTKGTNQISKEINSLESTFQKIGVAIAAAFSMQKIIGFGQEALTVASDLQEVQNVVDTTFEASSKTIDQFANTTLERFGLSELSAKQFSSTIGAMFKSMGLGKKEILDMSQGITGLAGDMASFYNLDPEVAFEKLRSGISGETEPLKQLGINMSVANLEAFALAGGIKKSYESMTQAEQATLRYQYIMKATADAQGDFEKTLGGSYANQTRVLKENVTSLAGALGELLLPAVTSIVSILNEVVVGITDLIEAASEGNIIAIAIVAIITTLTALFAAYMVKLLFTNAITSLWTAISGAATLTTTALGAAFAFLTGPIGLVVIAIASLIAVIVLVVKYWDEIKEKAIEVWKSIKETWSSVASWFNQTFIEPIKKGINSILGFAEGLANGFIDAANKIIRALNGINFSIPDWVPEIGGNEFGFNIKELSRVSLPKLATGAVIPPNSEFLAILGDQKHGTNIEAPLSTIEQAVDNALSRRGSTGGSSTIPIIIEIDGRELARVMAPYTAGEAMRQGTRLINGMT